MQSIANILPLLKKDYPDVEFVPGKAFTWSSKRNKIIYTTHQSNPEHGVWSLLHELGHAQLGHKDCSNDFDLIKIENKAWEQARLIGNKYGVTIDNKHVQDCLDTYRDWLHDRASCPKCKVVSLQRKDGIYQCFNCKTKWRVSKSQNTLIRKTIINKD